MQSSFFKNISESTKPYLIAEIGINHNGDVSIAKKLIDAANACGWDCVKFQKRTPEICVPDDQKMIKRDTPWGEMTYLDYKKKIEFEKHEYDIIDRYCNEKPIPWTVSIWDIPSLNFISNYDVPFIKIPSAHITNLQLLKESAQNGIPCIISTGMSDWSMVDECVNIFEKHSSPYALLHTNSTYPAPHSELNLNVMSAIKRRYGCTVGYSGHEYDLEPSVIAVALGADIIERHITLSHDMWGTDQQSSLEVHAMDLLRKRINDIKSMLGDSKKIITKSETEIAKKLRG
jgi:N-acetylneuraminate synthase